MFTLFTATRYLFAKKRHNTINFITWVSVAGVAVGTMALVVLLSVLNGFESVVQSSFSKFDPELKITPAIGKSFSSDNPKIIAAKQLELHYAWCEIVEQDGLLKYESTQTPALIKGVDDNYGNICNIDSLLWGGEIIFSTTERLHGALGIGLANSLHMGVDLITPITLFAPKSQRVNLSRPESNFTNTSFFSSAIFSVQQPKYDNGMVILPISVVRDAYLLNNNYTTSIELRIGNQSTSANDGDIDRVKASRSEVLGEDFQVLDRYEQQSDFYRITKIEKWTTFMILSFILLIATFNIIGSLSMIVIEKRNDITLFIALGASLKQIKDLFTIEGILISSLGNILGIVIGVAIVVIQEQFGLLKMGAGYISNVYPVELHYMDLIYIIAVVLSMGIIAAFYTANTQIDAYKKLPNEKL